MMAKRFIPRAAVVLSLAGLAACGPRYEGLSIQRVAGHEQARATEGRINVPEAGVFVFELDLESATGTRDYEVIDVVELDTVHSDVALLRPGLEADTWVLMGVSLGQTVVQVRVDGVVEDEIPVEVIVQEEISS